MEVIPDWIPIIREEIKAYAGQGINLTAYFVANEAQHVYAVIDIPDAKKSFRTSASVVARIVGDKVVIEEDLNDRQLGDQLVQAGIPREHIVLAYLGEEISSSQSG